MNRNTGSMRQIDLLKAVLNLETRSAQADGLSMEEKILLRRYKVALVEYFQMGFVREEHRNALRIPTHGLKTFVLLGHHDNTIRGRCRDFGVGGVFVEFPKPPPIGTLMRVLSVELEAMLLGSKVYEVFANGVVRWSKTDGGRPPEHMPVGMGLQFVDITAESRSRISDAFNYLLDELAVRHQFQL